VGPIVSVFADLSAARQLFDAPSPFLGVRQDNDTYTASVGVHADWGEVASVAAEVGATTRQFADPGLAPATGALLRASASWRPTETLTLGAAASYGIGAETADSGETTPIEARLSGSAAYVVNPWLTLRGSAGWSHVQKVGAAGAETRYDLGLGADYLINPMARLSADYAYSHRQREPDPPEYEHRASVGVTFSR
jgi:hypothetical protein